MLSIGTDAQIRNRFNWAMHRKKLNIARQCLLELNQRSTLDYNKVMHLCVKQQNLQTCRECYEDLLERGLCPDKYTFSILLNLCSKEGNAKEAEEILKQMSSYGIEMDEVNFNLLVRIYLRSNQESKALSVIQEMNEKGICPSLITYNIIIGGYSHPEMDLDGKTMLSKAEQALEALKSNGHEPDFRTYLALFRVAYKAEEFELVTQYIETIISSELSRDERDYVDMIYAFSSRTTAGREVVISMCWALYAHLRRKGIPVTIRTLNALTKVYTLLHRWDLVFGTWNHFQSFAVNPTASTYCILLDEVAALHDGYSQDHSLATSFIEMIDNSRVAMKPFVYEQLIKLMVKHQHVHGALHYLKRMKERKFKPDTSLYNLVMSLISDKNVLKDSAAAKTLCMRLFKEMREISVLQDDITYNTAIRAAIANADWITFQIILDFMKRDHHRLTLRSYNIIIDGCAKMENAKEGKKLAWKYFKELQNSKQTPSVVSYTTMINVCIKTQDVEKGIELFNEMTALDIQPTIQTYTTLMHLVGDGGDLTMAFELFDEIKTTGLVQNKIAYSCLLRACGKAKRFDKAIKVFSEFKKHFPKPNSRDYVGMIHAAGCCGRRDWVMEYYHEMQSQCQVISASVYNSTVKALIECEAYDEAKSVIKEMKHLGIHPGQISVNLLNSVA